MFTTSNRNQPCFQEYFVEINLSVGKAASCLACRLGRCFCAMAQRCPQDTRTPCNKGSLYWLDKRSVLNFGSPYGKGSCHEVTEGIRKKQRGGTVPIGGKTGLKAA